MISGPAYRKEDLLGGVKGMHSMIKGDQNMEKNNDQEKNTGVVVSMLLALKD